MNSPSRYILTVVCTDHPGIVHDITAFVLELGGNIVESQQFDDPTGDRFFLRLAFDVELGADDQVRICERFNSVAARHAMDWQLHAEGTRVRTLIMVSKFGHCLNDLLFRWQTGELNIDVVAVVSNHRDLEELAVSHGIEFHHIPVTPETKTVAEEHLLNLADELDVDLVVLARYMQVLSDEACKVLDGRAINIHHSFLPSFKGARPYQQASQRGVKLVGATAHYVTADLDEGPIVEQDVIRVVHSMDEAALVRAGREVESRVLSRALRWHADRRVLLNGSKTVVFA